MYYYSNGIEELFMLPVPEELMTCLRKIAFDNGYAVSVKTSKKNKSWIVCSRTGEKRLTFTVSLSQLPCGAPKIAFYGHVTGPSTPNQNAGV